MSGPPMQPRSLDELADDASGQLATEWVLLTATVVVPFMILTPAMIAMIDVYFYRAAEVVCLPFP